MDLSTISSVIAAVYPVIKDLVIVTNKRRGAIGNQEKFRKQLKNMTTIVQSDISQMKNEIESIREIYAAFIEGTGNFGSISWRTPEGISGLDAWKYRRASKKLKSLAEEFAGSIDGIIDVLSCCSGVMAGNADIIAEEDFLPEPDTGRELTRSYEELLRKVSSPDRHSVDEITNEMEYFLNQSKVSLQILSRSI